MSDEDEDWNLEADFCGKPTSQADYEDRIQVEIERLAPEGDDGQDRILSAICLRIGREPN